MAKTRHMFQQFMYSLLKRPVKIAFQVTIGASTANTFVGRGVESCDRTATGEYEIVLDSLYRKLYGVKITHLAATEAGFNFQLKSESVSSDGKIKFFALLPVYSDPNVVPTPTNLAEGDKLFIELLLNETDVV